MNPSQIPVLGGLKHCLPLLLLSPWCLQGCFLHVLLLCFPSFLSLTELHSILTFCYFCFWDSCSEFAEEMASTGQIWLHLAQSSAWCILVHSQ